MHAFMYVYPYVCNCACIYVCISVRMYMYVLMYMHVMYMDYSACTGYECKPHAHAHACIPARIHSYLGRLGSALSSERPQVLGLWRFFPSHPVLNSILFLRVCVECNRDHDVEKTNRSKPSLHLRRRKPWPLPTVRFLPQQPYSKEARSYHLYPATGRWCCQVPVISMAAPC